MSDETEIEKLTRRVQMMRADIEELSGEFAKLSDEELRKYAIKHREDADEAVWKSECAETALQLRELAAAFKT